MENEGRIIGEGFGQRERLTVRLRGLIRSYPRSIGIVKEFLQNADDAGATRLWVIWDGREHARDNLPDPRMGRLQGPALLFANDQVFSEADFQAIRSIGESSKSELGPKTGRFGLGFNTAYNVSDYPSFVSGRWAIAFDPHRVAVADADEPTGKRWELAELWERADDWLRPFSAGGLRVGELAHAGTIFRLPIRTPAQAAESEICDEPFDRGDFEQMLEDLEAAGDELLLFARNVLDLRVTAIDPDGTVRELLELTTVNSNEVQAKRAIGNAAVDGDTAENITTWRSDPETLARVAYRQMIALQTPKRREVRAWQVASGLFVDGYDRILRLNEQMLSLHEKALPWVGAAIRLDLRDDGRLAVAPRQRGKLFCTFPLPEQPVHLACHINGCFDLDASRRQISTDPALYAEADRARVAWNCALLEHAVPQAVALAISALAPDIAETSLTPYYDLWPDLSRPPDDPWRGFAEGLLRRLATLPLIRTRAGGEIAWEPLREARLPPPLWGELLQEALRDDGLRLPDPDLPGRMVKSAERADVVTVRYRPQQLRDWLRGDEPFAEAPLEEASRLCLRERSHVVDLLQFCLSDRKDDLAGLPLALCADGILRAFGSQPVFLADGPTRRLFEGHPEWFIDVGIQSGTRLRPCPEAQLDAMELPQVVTTIAGLLDPGDAATLAFDPDGEAPPNARWLAEVLRFFGERGDQLTADALDGVALFPDSRGQLHRAAAARPLLLPADDADPALLDALDAVGVVYVSTAPPLGDALRNFNRRRPGLMTPLSGPSLALAL
ncbi:MAG: hypothetical protein KC486_13575, partial [Myxococcales bacterium]|nr:hypothetical protein [Myxococcales bacterium]